MVIQGVVFDMDDTLYLEREYVRSGFKAIGHAVANVADANEVFHFLWDGFKSGVRGDAFNRLFTTFPAVADSHDIADLVKVYRDHTPDIEVTPEMKELLLTLRRAGVKLGLLSDGPLNAQQAKVDALGMTELVDHVLLTDSLGRECWKPSRAGFESLAKSFGLPHTALVYIGDNPVKDFIAPKELGWDAIRLRLPGQLHENEEPTEDRAEPCLETRSIQQLSQILIQKTLRP